MTEKEVLALIETKFWEKIGARKAAIFQLTEDKLCMPFSIFGKVLHQALGRKVTPRQVASPGRQKLLEELLGGDPHLTVEEMIETFPEDCQTAFLEASLTSNGPVPEAT